MRRDSIFSIHFLIVRGSCNQVRICKTTTPNARIRASILECCSLVFGDVFEVMMALAQSGLAENRRRRFFQAPGLGTHQQRIWSAGHLRTSKDDHDPDADAPTAKMKYMYALSVPPHRCESHFHGFLRPRHRLQPVGDGPASAANPRARNCD